MRRLSLTIAVLAAITSLMSCTNDKKLNREAQPTVSFEITGDSSLKVSATDPTNGCDGLFEICVQSQDYQSTSNGSVLCSSVTHHSPPSQVSIADGGSFSITIPLFGECGVLSRFTQDTPFRVRVLWFKENVKSFIDLRRPDTYTVFSKWYTCKSQSKTIRTGHPNNLDASDGK